MPKIPQSNNGLIGYKECLRDLKDRIQSAQIRAGLAVNRELVLLYWQIGYEILKRQSKEGWGAKIIEQLSIDLRHSFPEMTGLSFRNLKYMRAFAEVWPDSAIVPQLVAQIPWGHIRILLDKVKDPKEREWYVRATIENGWSRNVLVHQIESGLYNRQGKAQTNFEQTLPVPQSDLANQILKDPYNFDFLTIGKEAQEKDIERGLITQIRDFLLELGIGFAFIGSQYHLEVGEEDFYIDLPCHLEDKPSIGIMLCKGRDSFVAEYSLRDMRKPIGISEYSHKESLPEDLKGTLPTIEQIETGLDSLMTKDE